MDSSLSNWSLRYHGYHLTKTVVLLRAARLSGIIAVMLISVQVLIF